MRKIFIDCGAWKGNSLIYLNQTKSDFKEYDKYAFECNPYIASRLEENLRVEGIRTKVIRKAVWIVDGMATMKIGSNVFTESGSIILSKRIIRYDKRHNKDTMVDTIDFCKWLDSIVQIGDECIIKMNIEGAEYAVLNKLIDNGVIKKVSELMVSWHYNKIGLPEAQHLSLLERLKINDVNYKVWSLEHGRT